MPQFRKKKCIVSPCVMFVLICFLLVNFSGAFIAPERKMECNTAAQNFLKESNWSSETSLDQKIHCPLLAQICYKAPLTIDYCIMPELWQQAPVALIQTVRTVGHHFLRTYSMGKHQAILPWTQRTPVIKSAKRQAGCERQNTASTLKAPLIF